MHRQSIRLRPDQKNCGWYRERGIRAQCRPRLMNFSCVCSVFFPTLQVAHAHRRAEWWQLTSRSRIRTATAYSVSLQTMGPTGCPCRRLALDQRRLTLDGQAPGHHRRRQGRDVCSAVVFPEDRTGRKNFAPPVMTRGLAVERIARTAPVRASTQRADSRLVPSSEVRRSTRWLS